jgi:hypothetical protein
MRNDELATKIQNGFVNHDKFTLVPDYSDHFARNKLVGLVNFFGVRETDFCHAIPGSRSFFPYVY